MMLKTDAILAERYIDGDLSPAEKEKFEIRLQSDPRLLEYIEMSREIEKINLGVLILRMKLATLMMLEKQE